MESDAQRIVVRPRIFSTASIWRGILQVTAPMDTLLQYAGVESSARTRGTHEMPTCNAANQTPEVLDIVVTLGLGNPPQPWKSWMSTWSRHESTCSFPANTPVEFDKQIQSYSGDTLALYAGHVANLSTSITFRHAVEKLQRTIDFLPLDLLPRKPFRYVFFTLTESLLCQCKENTFALQHFALAKPTTPATQAGRRRRSIAPKRFFGRKVVEKQ